MIGVFFLLISFFIDAFILQAVEYIKTPGLDLFFRFVTNSLLITTLLLVVPCIFMWYENKRDWILPMGVSYGCAVLAGVILKLMIARERPHVLAQDMIFLKYSFPSLHAIVSTATLPLLFDQYKELRWVWIGVAVLGITSRLYLQVHYLSDVIAGAIIGLGIGWLIMYYKESRG